MFQIIVNVIKNSESIYRTIFEIGITELHTMI